MKKKHKKQKETKVVRGALITRAQWLKTVMALTGRAIAYEGTSPELGQSLGEQFDRYGKELQGLVK
jgi:hypothetical protein